MPLAQRWRGENIILWYFSHVIRHLVRLTFLALAVCALMLARFRLMYMKWDVNEIKGQWVSWGSGAEPHLNHTSLIACQLCLSNCSLAQIPFLRPSFPLHIHRLILTFCYPLFPARLSPFSVLFGACNQLLAETHLARTQTLPQFFPLSAITSTFILNRFAINFDFSTSKQFLYILWCGIELIFEQSLDCTWCIEVCLGCSFPHTS